MGKACGMFRQRTLGWWIGKTIRLWGRMQLVVKPAGWRNGCGAAVAAGVMAVIAGLSASFQWDTPTGPSIVVAASVLFALASLFAIVRPKHPG